VPQCGHCPDREQRPFDRVFFLPSTGTTPILHFGHLHILSAILPDLDFLPDLDLDFLPDLDFLWEAPPSCLRDKRLEVLAERITIAFKQENNFSTSSIKFFNYFNYFLIIYCKCFQVVPKYFINK